MKKIVTFLLILISAFSLTSCGYESPETEMSVTDDDIWDGDARKTLIVFFSWGGNTRTVANYIHDLIGGDIVEVETVTPYPDRYEEVIRIAPQELANDYRPPLKTRVDNMDEYDILIVGTPIWGGHLTPAMKSFLASYDLSGKTIAPFCTHGGSGTSQSVNDIRSVCSDDVTFLTPLAVYGNQAEYAFGDVEEWLTKISIIKQ